MRITSNHGSGIISVYTGAPGSFAIVSGGCNSYSFNSSDARIAGLRLAPNTTYSIETAAATTNLNPGDALDFSVVSATQYHVTKTADTNDGSCDLDCSLREAISASNANPGAVIIPAGTYTLSISGPTENNTATGDLDAMQGMGIYGAGMNQTVIDANHIDRVLHLDAGDVGIMAFALGDLTLKNGSATSGDGRCACDWWGGGLSALSGVFGSDFVGLERVAVVSNFYSQPGRRRNRSLAGAGNHTRQLDRQ